MDARVFIATPTHNSQVCTRYVLGLLQTLKMLEDRGIDSTISFRGGDPLIDRARNEIVHEFLSTDYTHLLFIDSDMGFCSKNLARLLDKNAELVASICPQRRYKWEKEVIPASTHELESQLLTHNCKQVGSYYENGFIEVNHVGTAFMLIQRLVFEKIKEACPELEYQHEGWSRWAYFQHGIDPETGEWCGEDVAFCRKWRNLGGRIFVDLAHPLVHVGSCDYGEQVHKHFCELWNTE